MQIRNIIQIQKIDVWNYGREYGNNKVGLKSRNARIRSRLEYKNHGRCMHVFMCAYYMYVLKRIVFLVS